MRKAILCGLAFVIMSLGCTVADAGVVRVGYKVTRAVVKHAPKVVKTTAKVAYKVVL